MHVLAWHDHHTTSQRDRYKRTDLHHGVDPADREAVAAVYSELKRQVTDGLATLRQEVRPSDPYSDLVKRTAWETLYGVQAPGPPDPQS